MNKSYENSKTKLRNKLSLKGAMEDFFSEKPNIEITDNTLAIIEGCKGVLEYSDSVIRISFGNYTVAFVGRGMKLKCISPTSLEVEGFILNIEFSI